GLTRQTAALYGGDHVILTFTFGSLERLVQEHAQGRTGEINRLVTTVDDDLAGAGLYPYTSHSVFALAGGIGAAVSVKLRLGRSRSLGFGPLGQGLQVFQRLFFFGHD